MHIQTRAGTDVAETGRLDRFRAREVLRRREFDVAGFAGKDAYLYAGPFGESRIVGEVVPSLREGAPMGVKQRRKCKCLRRLYQADGIAIESCFNRARAVDAFDGVRHW